MLQLIPSCRNYGTPRARDMGLLPSGGCCFWLFAGMCLGPDGFGFCDAKSLWILAYTCPGKKRKAIVSMLAPEPERMCLGSSSGGWFSSLRPVGVSKCVIGDGQESGRARFGSSPSY